MESNFVKVVLGIAAGFLLALHTLEPKAQTVQMTQNGQVVGTVQINGNTAQFVNVAGVTTQTATLYPDQVVIQNPSLSNNSIVVGRPSYSVPSSPPTPVSPKVMQ